MNKNTTPFTRKQYNVELPHALQNLQLKERFLESKPAVFLDYDGCLTPIVQNPEDAVLSDEMRSVLHDLAAVCFVAVVSGRDRENVENLVQLDNLYYAGSHGFDISGPDNLKTEPGGAKSAIPALEEAEMKLQTALKHIPGVLIERKRYAIAVHYRNVAADKTQEVKEKVYTVLDHFSELKPGPGKKIIELKPNLDWHKGKAVEWLLHKMKLDTEKVVPVYIGDDLTDEDAFTTLQDYGVTILVGNHDEKTAANYRLENVEEVKAFLKELTEISKRN